MGTLIFISTPIITGTLYYLYVLLIKPFNLEKDKTDIVENIKFKTAISAMKEYSLVRIILNDKENRRRTREALYHLKRTNLDLYSRVELKIS